MPLLARVMFSLVDLAARNGLAEPVPRESAAKTGGEIKRRARRTGVRGETYAYWYLRRRGYVFLARNYTSPGTKGEIDLVGYDGPVLAFVEVKTRAAAYPDAPQPEESVTPEKRRALTRIAWQFLNQWGMRGVPYRFDVLALESRAGQRPVVRLHKDAFPPQR